MATTAKKQTAPTPAASTATPDAGAPTPGTVQVLQVISKRDGFRRAGREWHGTTSVPLSELTSEQYRQIEAEPMLVTLLLEVPEGSVADLAAADGHAGGETGT